MWCHEQAVSSMFRRFFEIVLPVESAAKRIRGKINGNATYEWSCSKYLCVVFCFAVRCYAILYYAVLCCAPNRLLLNAHSRDLIKMCESMTIITVRLDKYLPIEYFNECYFT